MSSNGTTLLERFFLKLARLFAARRPNPSVPATGHRVANVGVLKQGNAMRVLFFYPGEEGTYVDAAHVTLFENGIVHLRTRHEETTTSIGSCEILWNFENPNAESGAKSDSPASKIRYLRPGQDARDPGGSAKGSDEDHEHHDSDDHPPEVH